VRARRKPHRSSEDSRRPRPEPRRLHRARRIPAPSSAAGPIRRRTARRRRRLRMSVPHLPRLHGRNRRLRRRAKRRLRRHGQHRRKPPVRLLLRRKRPPHGLPLLHRKRRLPVRQLRLRPRRKRPVRRRQRPARRRAAGRLRNENSETA
jgi:hypothetical protein